MKYWAKTKSCHTLQKTLSYFIEYLGIVCSAEFYTLPVTYINMKWYVCYSITQKGLDGMRLNLTYI